jgi:hypothetical protein
MHIYFKAPLIDTEEKSIISEVESFRFDEFMKIIS